MNNKGIALEASFSPDSNYVFSGSTDGQIYGWSSESGRLVATLPSEHNPVIQCVQFNPKYMMLATACNHMVRCLYTFTWFCLIVRIDCARAMEVCLCELIVWVTCNHHGKLSFNPALNSNNHHDQPLSSNSWETATFPGVWFSSWAKIALFFKLK